LADQIVVINTATDAVEAVLPCPAGCHGVNWGAKQGGGYYAYVTPQHSNVMVVVDPDVNGDGYATDAAIVGIVSLANSPTDFVTDGTGGQGVKPIPNVVNGWIQNTVSNFDELESDSDVRGFLCGLTSEQRDPNGHLFAPTPEDISCP
jgi:hypothetical protein